MENNKKTKLAVIFPGVGYHVDKPLLYYSKKLAAAAGYTVVEVSYGNLPAIRKDKKLTSIFEVAQKATEKSLKHIDFQAYDDVLFIAKSIGTCVCGAYAHSHRLHTRNILYTPVKATFSLVHDSGIAFSGTNDQMIDLETAKAGCAQCGMELHIIEGANHSLETGDVLVDSANIHQIMEITAKYISGE